MTFVLTRVKLRQRVTQSSQPRPATTRCDVTSVIGDVIARPLADVTALLLLLFGFH